MRNVIFFKGLFAAALLIISCQTEQRGVDLAELKSQPQQYVGSEECRSCHLEHYDSWQLTNHGRMAQNAKENRNAFVVSIDREAILADFKKAEEAGKLGMPLSEVYIPDKDEILYTIGNEWKQRYIVDKDGVLYISPIQFNIDSGRWVPYHPKDWDQRPWLLKCGGCHTTGTKLDAENMAQSTFSEPGVGCEGCHGPGSWHVALPKQALFEKRETIINPDKLPRGTAVQICGACHNRGRSTQVKGAGWPVGWTPGEALEPYYVSTSYASGDTGHMYPNEFSKGHHQQYIDWMKSRHAMEGISCTSCHYVHRLGASPTRFQIKESGSQSCRLCHVMINNNMAHAIHSFGNCVGCHMPMIAKSAESGDIHSHVFQALLPQVTMEDKDIPNSCQSCHRHSDDDLATLQRWYDELAQMPKPQGKVIDFIRPSQPEEPEMRPVREGPAQSRKDTTN